MTFESDLKIVVDIFTKLSLDNKDDLLFIQNILLVLKGEFGDEYEKVYGKVYVVLYNKYLNYIKYKVGLEIVDDDIDKKSEELTECIKQNLFEEQSEDSNILKIIEKIFFNDINKKKGYFLNTNNYNKKLLDNIKKGKKKNSHNSSRYK